MKTQYVCSSFALLLASGCGGPADTTDFTQRQQDIIGGFHASSAALNHTGALVLIGGLSGELVPFCSSTLIGPETVVTAKHCAQLLPFIELNQLGSVAWAAGPRATAPLELIPIAAVDTAPGDVGGFVGLGRDTAIVHLDRPTSIVPAVPKLADASLVGKAMVSIGYGVYGAGGNSDDQRRIGRETVAGIEGRTFEVMFGSFENFVEWAFTGQVTPEDFLATIPPDDPFLEFLRHEFDTVVLFDQHEAITGLAPTDTQSCFGDSGGPLALFKRNGVTETYGVVSGGLSSVRMVCDFGTVFSTFGPQTIAFLESSLEWVDPCGEVSSEGQCDGNVARNCDTNFNGNIRRLTEADCGAAGLACQTGPAGAGCGAPPEPEPAEPPDPEAPEIVLEAAREAARPAVSSQLPWTAP